MNLSTLAITLALVLQFQGPVCRSQEDGDCRPSTLFQAQRAAPLTPQTTWAYIVTGESSGRWPEGSALVAWTLRAWQVHKGMPAAMAGRRWGWNGWKPPTHEAWTAVQTAWNQPLGNAPFEFMQAGHWCSMLLSPSDRAYLKLGPPDYVLSTPDSAFQMLCYFG